MGKTSSIFPLIKAIIVFTVLVVAISSCNPNRVFEKNIDIPNKIWSKDFKPEFEFEISDTNLIYSLSVNVRHTNFYPFSNLWVMAYTTFPDGKTISSRVELPLADKDGKWFGDCLGDICDANISIQEKTLFNQIGKHKITFEQIMRNKSLNVDELPAIMAIGLKVEKLAESK